MTDPRALYNQFFQIVERGDETAARKFILDHLNEFDEDSKNEILFGLFEDALATQVNNAGAIADFKKKGAAMLKDMAQERRDLEDRLKLVDIKESL